MSILEKINREQNARNCFTCVSSADLDAISTAVEAMVYFGYKRERAEIITINNYLNGKPYREEHLIRCQALNS